MELKFIPIEDLKVGDVAHGYMKVTALRSTAKRIYYTTVTVFPNQPQGQPYEDHQPKGSKLSVRVV